MGTGLQIQIQQDKYMETYTISENLRLHRMTIVTTNIRRAINTAAASLLSGDIVLFEKANLLIKALRIQHKNLLSSGTGE